MARNKNAEFLQNNLYGGMYNPALGYFSGKSNSSSNK